MSLKKSWHGRNTFPKGLAFCSSWAITVRTVLRKLFDVWPWFKTYQKALPLVTSQHFMHLSSRYWAAPMKCEKVLLWWPPVWIVRPSTSITILLTLSTGWWRKDMKKYPKLQFYSANNRAMPLQFSMQQRSTNYFFTGSCLRDPELLFLFSLRAERFKSYELGKNYG